MTRVLSELLGAPEPFFSQRLSQLERLAGHPRADIRLSTSVQHATKAKLRELGLDMIDTSGHELYAALGQRLRDDEVRFVRAVQGVEQDAELLVSQIARAVVEHSGSRATYAMKAVVARRLLKAQAPKKTMKALGYRSLDSMLKHESVAALFAAAWLVESDAWTKRIFAAYAKLQPTDFETHDISVESPSSKRWQTLGDSVVAHKRHAVLSFKELGAVILLPLPEKRPALASLTSAVLALRAVNEIRAAGTFLKLHQMHGRFGAIVQQVIATDPKLDADGLDEVVSWHSLHQYFARFEGSARTSMFEPVVAAGELAWTNVEQAIAKIAPALGFWEQTAHLAFLDTKHQIGKSISLNLTDGLLSHSNGLAFDKRLGHHFQQSLSAELLLSYLNHDMLEKTFFNGVQRKLAPEMAMM